MLSLFALCLTARAETFGSITSGLSYNRLGASVLLQHGVRYSKWEKEGNVLFQDTGIQLLGEANITPALVQPGIRLTVNPIAIMKLQGYAFGDYYFGNFQSVVGYDDLGANYGTNADIENYVEETQRQYAGGGWHAGGKLVLQAKVKNVVVLNAVDYGYYNVFKPEGEAGTATFERVKEVMIAFDGDQILENNTMVFYQKDREDGGFLRIGSLTSYRKSFQADDQLLRSGLIGMLQPTSGGMHIVICQPYLTSRAFEGAWAAPYLAYAFKYSY